MIKQLTRIRDFGALIDAVNSVIECYNSGNYDNASLQNEILAVSDPIISSKINSENNIKTYSGISVAIVENLKNNKLSQAEMGNWVLAVKQNIACMFATMTVGLNNDGMLFSDCDDELDQKLLKFFSGDSLPVIVAHFFAVRRYAKKDPMFCYKLSNEDFKKAPDLVSKIYNEISYVYDADAINDEIYEKCPICGSEDTSPFFCVNQALADRNGFSPAKLWMKCNKCSNLFAYNFPVMKMGEINGHYTKKNENGILTPRMILSVYCDIFNGIKAYNNGNRYLEIGVGNGEMLAVALEMGYDVSAVEICKEDCENISGALGVDIVWTDFLKYETDKRFDIIVMGDILEHVSAPITALKKAYDLLDKGGILWLSTPNFNSAFTRMRKFTDPMWNQANHFTYFSFDGLKPFLDEIGFSVEKYEVSRRYNGSMELILRKI